MKFSKKYKKALELVDIKKQYSIEEACDLVKKTSTTKFDSTVDVSFALGIDTTQADQQIRGTLTLPHGNGKKVKILALTNTKADDAKAAGADYVGAKEMLDKVVQQNWFDFDVIVCTPDMMGEIGKAGKVLGPKGLMPNPKAGTVTPDIKKAINEIKAGKIEYRVDKDGNTAITIGRVSFDSKKLAENLSLICDTLMKVRPSTVKNVYIKNAVVHTTMGPGVHFTFEGRN